jgi:hypothetical protein
LGKSFFVALTINFFLTVNVLGGAKTFGALAKECLMKYKRFFYHRTKRNILASANEISEMKQTKNWL